MRMTFSSRTRCTVFTYGMRIPLCTEFDNRPRISHWIHCYSWPEKTEDGNHRLTDVQPQDREGQISCTILHALLPRPPSSSADANYWGGVGFWTWMGSIPPFEKRCHTIEKGERKGVIPGKTGKSSFNCYRDKERANPLHPSSFHAARFAAAGIRPNTKCYGGKPIKYSEFLFCVFFFAWASVYCHSSMKKR